MELGVLPAFKSSPDLSGGCKLDRIVVFSTASARVSSLMPFTHHRAKSMARMCKACLLGR